MKVKLAGSDLAYDVSGDGPTLCLLHAFPFHRGMWRPQVEALRGSWRVVTFDARGFGESPRGDGLLTMERIADDAIALLDHLAEDQAVFAGLSMGGYAAFALHRRHRDRVRALVLADTRAEADTDEGRAGRAALSERVRREALNLRTPPPVPIVPPLVPIAVEIEVEPFEFEETVEIDPASVLGEEPGLLEGPGLENGTGQGDGGNAEEGLFRLQPASPRGMIIPPTNKSLRGTEVQVWVFVDERGRVVSDSTRLDPPTRDRGFNRRLIREAAEWVFRPAVQEGSPVASWFPYRISMD